MPSIVEIALAAVLHEVGRLYQRAHSDRPPAAVEGPMPASYASWVVERHALLFSRVGVSPEWLAQTVSHRLDNARTPDAQEPQSAAGWTIHYAGDYASVEREELPRGGGAAARASSLVPIFSRIELERRTEQQPPWSYALEPFAAGKTYPVPGSQASVEPQAYRERLIGPLDERLRGLVAFELDGPAALLANLLGFLQEVAWCVPAGNQQEQSVALYDHARLMAAIGSALWAYQLDREDGQPTRAGLQSEEQEKFLLAVGDLGGIQEHIYRIASAQTGTGGIAKRLRARSLEVSLSAEAMTFHILGALGLPAVQRIMSAGGKFYLLLPNTAEAIAALQGCREEWEAHSLAQGATLIPNLAWTAFAPKSFQRFHEVVREAHQALAQVKARPFQTQLQTAYLVFSGVRGATATPRPCKAYSVVPAQGEGRDPEHSWQATRDWQVGTRLPKLVEPSLSLHEPGYREDAAYPFPRSTFALGQQGRYVLRARDDFRPSQRPWEMRPLLGHVPAVRHALFKRDLEWFRARTPEEGDAPEEREPDSTLSLGELADLSQGVPYLGALMLDADRMGEVFARGFRVSGSRGEEQSSSPSRIATLSRMLETFFALEVATLIREPERYADRLAWPEGAEPGHKAWKANHYPLIYSVYAGGDDLFLLGPWNVILEFALDLAPLYRAYTQHPGFTLSGGFATMRPHLPIPQLSQLVKSLEEDAKVANKADEARRGHLALFGQAVPWDSLLEVRRWAEGLQRDLEGRRVSKAQVYRWLRLHREYTRSLTVEADVGRAMRYKPLLAYALRPKGQQDQDLHERYGDLLNHAHPAWVHLPVWVQWGLYAQREDLHDRVL